MDPRRALRPLQKLAPLTVGVLSALYGAPLVADDAGISLQEVIVTATRRAESAQDIPASITAVTGAELEQAGITSTVDLARSLAGIDVIDKGPFGGVNGSSLIIRGLNSDSTAGEFVQSSPIVQPVATYVDDTPLFVNLRLQDLDRVEILRGPQGTLYGSGSLGGTIRYVQNAPDPQAFDAKVEVGLSDTEHTEIVGARGHSLDVNGGVADGEIVANFGDAGDVLERRGEGAEAAEFGRGQAHLAGLVFIGFGELDDAVGLREWKRSEENAVDDGEDGGVRSDSESEGEDGS